MRRQDTKNLFAVLILFAVSLSFIGGDCGSETEEPPAPPSGVAAPTNLNVQLDAVPGGSSFALLAWTGSTDESDANFRGYRVTTYRVNDSGTNDSLLLNEALAKNQRTYTVPSLQWRTRYRSYVVSELTDGTKSDSVVTPIYAGVYYNTDGIIDEFTLGNTESGFGWDPINGNGIQYSYTAQNAPNIDLHMRRDGTQLKFYSPNTQSPGTKTTLFRLLGTGDDAFDDITDLLEPDLTSINVNNDEVYLLKTDEGYYIKVHITQINNQTGIPPYSEAVFEYKVQPLQGLRVLKR